MGFLIKRIADIFFASIGLIFSAPLWIVFSVLIWQKDKRRPFYLQTRVGKNKREFILIKFRTMCVGAEDDSGPVLSHEKDMRVTAIGRFLRRTALDELPQLLNILKGEMSFVGPRPERPTFVSRYLYDIENYGERFTVRPGLTGLAQVSASYKAKAIEKLAYDLEYIKKQNVWLDIRIFMQSLKNTLQGKWGI